MNYELAQTFIVLAKTKNISHAASILFASQSTVSYRLKVLENEMGGSLFLRQKGKTTGELTELGQLLVPRIESWMELWNEMAELKNHNPESRLCIGCVDSLATHLFQDFFQDFVVEHPDVRFRLFVLHTDEMYEKLKTHEIDLGIVLQNFMYPDMDVRPLFSEEMCCVHSIDELADRAINPGRLDLHKEVFLNWGVEFRLWHDFWFKASTEPKLQVNTLCFVEEALRRGNKWSIVPKSVAWNLTKRGICKQVDLENPPPDRISYIITRSIAKDDQRELIRNFIVDIERYIKQLPYKS